MRRTFSLIAIIALVILASASNASASTTPARSASCGRSFDPKILDQLQHIVTMVHTTYRIPGMVAAATVPGKGCWMSVTGYANKARRIALVGLVNSATGW